MLNLLSIQLYTAQELQRVLKHYREVSANPHASLLCTAIEAELKARSQFDERLRDWTDIAQSPTPFGQ